MLVLMSVLVLALVPVPALLLGRRLCSVALEIRDQGSRQQIRRNSRNSSPASPWTPAHISGELHLTLGPGGAWFALFAALEG